MKCLPSRHDWQQVSVHCEPTTFPGNRTNLAVAVLTGDYCMRCNKVRTPTKLDKVRWPVRSS